MEDFKAYNPTYGEPTTPKVGKIKVGSSDVSKIYQGSTLVWPLGSAFPESYSTISGSALKSGNGDFGGDFPLNSTYTSVRFTTNPGGTSDEVPIIRILKSELEDAFNGDHGHNPSGGETYEFNFGYTASFSGSSGDDGELFIDIFYSSSTDSSLDTTPNPFTFTAIGEESSVLPNNTLEIAAGDLLFNTSSDWGTLYFGPQFKVEDNRDNINYKFTNFSIGVYIDDSTGTGDTSTFTLATNVSQSNSTHIGLNGWNIYDTYYSSSS